MFRHALIAAWSAVALASVSPAIVAEAQSGRLEYRVVHAAPYQLQQVIDAAGRDGFACASVARPETDVALPGVVVTLSRPYVEITHVYPTVVHRVVRASGSGGDFADLLAPHAATGYRLCGVALAEAKPVPVLVGVMVPDEAPPAGGRHYAAALVGNAERVARLATLGRQGFVPLTATPVNDNRVPEQRSWMVVAEQSTATPVDIVVRARPGPDSLEKAIREQTSQGFTCRLLWKDGLTSLVVLLSRVGADQAGRPECVVDTIDPARLNGRSGDYAGDVSYLSDGQRLSLTVTDRVSTIYTVSDSLPPLGSRDVASSSDLQPLGEHLGRDRSHERARIVSSTVRRGPRDSVVLHTVLVEHSR